MKRAGHPPPVSLSVTDRGLGGVARVSYRFASQYALDFENWILYTPELRI